MPVLSATNLKHAYGLRIILDGVSFSIEPGERVGVVGRNGVGKSTLLKMLAGLMTPDSGEVVLQRGARAGYLHQDPKLNPEETLWGEAESAFARLHELHQKLDHLYEEMATAEGARLEKLLDEQTKLTEAMEAAGGYSIDHKIAEILHGLGFTDSQFKIKVSGLSGGQKGRLALAKLLLENPDVLLLDEPTNHLDIEGRLWLENFLKNDFPGAVLLISHDRYLLDNVVQRIVETEDGRLIDYPGNYETFRELRAERRLAMLRAYENQQQRFRQEEAYIRKYKAGRRAAQAKGRETKLERAKEQDQLEKPPEAHSFEIRLPEAPRSGDMVFSAREVSKVYPLEDGGEKPLFRNLDILVSRGERWGIIGPNGAGKSTLVRTLLGEITPNTGTVRLGSNVRVGYYRQTHEHLPAEKPVYQFLQDTIKKEVPGVQMSEQAARDLAGAFLFSGSDQDRPLGQLSGGERSRAAIAALLCSAKNMLVLDEPTNHLDLMSAERLEEALCDEGGYEGTLILISHDRALIDGTCDHLIVLDGAGNVEIFHGSYSEWHEKDVQRRRERDRAESDERSRREEQERQRKAAEDRKKAEAAKPRQKSPSLGALERMKTEQIEEKIEKLQTRIKEIDAALNDPEVWRDHARASKLSDERNTAIGQLEPLEFEWERRASEA
ncbi:MAG: ABC-F family ATP-binding cassette domain-containing protein [Phycisphaerales bacterium]